MCSLPEIFCLWASEPYSLLCHNIKYLAGKIRKGNWATPWNARWPLPLFAFDEDAAGKVGVELIRAKRGELAAARLESVLTSCRQVVGYVAHPTSHKRTSGQVGDPSPDDTCSPLQALRRKIARDVDAYASGITQLVLDISSYFAP